MSWDALRVAATDRSSGSSTIALRAARAFAETDTGSGEEIVAAARTLVRGQPIMAACLRVAAVVLSGLEADGVGGARRAAAAIAERLESERERITQIVGDVVPIHGTILTVSASSVVLGALCALPGIRVICAASEPGGEGRAAADALTSCGIDAIVIPDGTIAQQSTRADAIAFGADAIGPDALLNKTGTLAATLGARSNGRAVLCISGTTKIVDAHAWPKMHTAAERLKLEGVGVFEEVPTSLVTAFVTEDGKQTARAIRRAARNAGLPPILLSWLDE